MSKHGALNYQRATCIGCSCDDFHACQTEEGPCSWLEVDYAAGLGVCSNCEEHMERWGKGDRTLPPMIVAKIVMEGETEPFYIECADMASFPYLLGNIPGDRYQLEWVSMSKEEFEALPQFSHIHEAKKWAGHIIAAREAEIAGDIEAQRQHQSEADKIEAALASDEWDVRELTGDFLDLEEACVIRRSS